MLGGARIENKQGLTSGSRGQPVSGEIRVDGDLEVRERHRMAPVGIACTAPHPIEGDPHAIEPPSGDPVFTIT